MQAQIIKERRQPEGKMTDAQFREFTMLSFTEGERRFAELHRKIDDHFGSMSAAIGENTVVTKQAADLAAKAVTIAEKTQKDTAGLVSFYQFGERAADVVATSTTNASRFSKIMIPIIVLMTITATLWHGEPLRWKDVLEALK